MFLYPVDEEVSLMLLQKKDRFALHERVEECREYLSEWLPWAVEMKGPDDYLPFIEASLKQFAENRGFQTGILYRGELAGVIGFHEINWRSKNTSIGYWLAAKYQGRGIMTRACRALLDIAFCEYGLRRVEIRCAEGNLRSRAIPERLGFSKEGILKDAVFVGGRYHSIVVYGMTVEDYEERKRKEIREEKIH
jgi:ribosomal-protein-serine acetyltransferase